MQILAPTRCPAVLGHEAAGVVEEGGPGTSLVRPGDRVALSWAPYCGVCEQCLRELPQLCEAAWPAMDAGGLLDGSSRLSRDGATVYHYSLLSTFAEMAVVPERACVPIAGDIPSRSPALSAARSPPASALSREPPEVGSGDRRQPSAARRRAWPG
jgi:S-(hydroxymethyl)glutathione dehydrogenase/alcohol dehydrogenase